MLIGSTHSAGTHRIKEFLMRNGHPYTFIDLELDPDVQNLLDSFHITASEIPVVICRGKVVLRNPNNQEIAVCLGFNEAIDQTQARTSSSSAPVPLGWLPAVYGASEGLDVLMLETNSPGGRQIQAQESKIIWDFPTVSLVRSWRSGVPPGTEVRRGDAHHQGHQTRLRQQTVSRRSRKRDYEFRHVP